MRDHLVRFATPLAFFGMLAACSGSTPGATGSSGAGNGGAGSTSSSASTGNGGGNGSGGGNGTSSGGGASTSTGTSSGGGSAATGWTPVALLDDMSDPSNPVFRSGNDLVTGIYFASIDDGWVTTTGSNDSDGNGGAVYKAQQKQVTDLLFSGNRDGLCLDGTIDFHGIDTSPDGLVALAYACDVIASHDGGKTFGIQPALAGSMFGIENVLTMRSRASGTLMVADTGYVSTTSGAPGPSAVWTDTWAPEGVPPVPNPVPADECQAGPASAEPTQRTSVYVSPDGSLVAYVSTSLGDAPQICLSTDGGNSFLPKLLPGVSSDAMDYPPTGVTFASATTGITWWATSISTGTGYVYRTTDGGQTWNPVTLPSAVVSGSIELASAFFAPDGMTGFIIGYDYDASIPLLLRSEDGGATWASSGGDLAAKVTAAGGGKLFSGFALDANHIWVGGDYGVLMASDTSGQ
jgi:hypothetical protein